MLDRWPIGSSSFGGSCWGTSFKAGVRECAWRDDPASGPARRLRVEIVEFGGCDQRVECSGAPAAFVGVLSPKGKGPQLPRRAW